MLPPRLSRAQTSATRLSPLMMRLNSSKETVIETSSSPKAIICLSVASSALALTRSIAVLSRADPSAEIVSSDSSSSRTESSSRNPPPPVCVSVPLPGPTDLCGRRKPLKCLWVSLK